MSNNKPNFYNLRVGNGFDSHRLETGHKLILGGIEIPFDRGLVGHSDADVLTHAIIDSLVGATGLGDIGEHFPPTDPQYKNVSSIKLLKEITQKLLKQNWVIINIDCILICEQPKISPHKKSILESLAKALDINEDRINLKGKTAEKLGSIGREEGIAAIVVSLVEKIKPD